MKKAVSSSHLALRFYRSAGWTLECLQKYLLSGVIKDTLITHGDSEVNAYFLLDVGSALDVEKILENEVSSIKRWYAGPPKESDIEYFKSFNW